MARKKGLKQYSDEELVQELARRNADALFQDGMTMTDMELAVDALLHRQAEPSIAVMLARLKPETPTPKACPRCGKRTPVKAPDRERTVRSLAGPITFKRNYHYCEGCKFGFCPVDRMLSLPEEGELTSEMEKRVLDFAVNDVYGECAARWRLHYGEPISENLLRRVVARVGAQCESSDQTCLQEELKPKQQIAPECLVVEADGSMLPIRGDEPWKEAKVAVVYRHDVETQRPVKGSSRFLAVVGGLGEFAPLLEDVMHVERVDEAMNVVWLGDGARYIWRLAEQLAPDAKQILDWMHAVQHGVDCGKVLLDEESPYLPLWQARVEALLAASDVDALVSELMDCLSEISGRRRDAQAAVKALDDLVRYYRNNESRMNYRIYREHGLPIGSGAVESAHRHVLQSRMKRAGQRWAMRNARRMARLRAAYRTGGALGFYEGIQRARLREPDERTKGRRNGYRYARYGCRDWDAMEKAASN